MEKFTITRHGYNPEEVNHFFDTVLKKMELLVKECNEKNSAIAKLQKELQNHPEIERLELENTNLKEKIRHFEQMEETLNRAILMAQKTADQMRSNAHEQCEIILTDAKKNASRIINEALLQSEKIQKENDLLRRNMVVFKRRIKGVIETQLEVINDIEKIEL